MVEFDCQSRLPFYENLTSYSLKLFPWFQDCSPSYRFTYNSSKFATEVKKYMVGSVIISFIYNSAILLPFIQFNDLIEI